MLLGGVLGVFDGLSALLSGGPEIPSMIGGIVAGSTFKGVVAGLIVGLVARTHAVDGDHRRRRPGRSARSSPTS